MQKLNKTVADFSIAVRQLVKAAYPMLNVAQCDLITKGASFLCGLTLVIHWCTLVAHHP